MTELVLSCLPKTWLIDIDGVILKHNGYKQDGEILLPGVKKFWNQISKEDFVVLLTARTEEMREATLSLLENDGLRYNIAIFGVPTGERICINDKKPSGLLTSYAVNLGRDVGLDSLRVVENPDL
ncbi:MULTISPECIES: hypothetical protein [unclassified Moorena]|uniref:hypothetical protein n=1 Tax=unclassified Moorena TaxID=2683338 RepID=UPI0014017AB0|nr:MULTISPECIES: hypothetical protein [unclassified Moorena]NEO15813.1 hypothetical protein [Moorena sp. SIO3E8]NEQ01583.1 hypothetical protein [Moorena sp. SIO3F7]